MEDLFFGWALIEGRIYFSLILPSSPQVQIWVRDCGSNGEFEPQLMSMTRKYRFFGTKREGTNFCFDWSLRHYWQLCPSLPKCLGKHNSTSIQLLSLLYSCMKRALIIISKFCRSFNSLPSWIIHQQTLGFFIHQAIVPMKSQSVSPPMLSSVLYLGLHLILNELISMRHFMAIEEI